MRQRETVMTNQKDIHIFKGKTNEGRISLWHMVIHGVLLSALRTPKPSATPFAQPGMEVLKKLIHYQTAALPLQCVQFKQINYKVSKVCGVKNLNMIGSHKQNSNVIKFKENVG